MALRIWWQHPLVSPDQDFLSRTQKLWDPDRIIWILFNLVIAISQRSPMQFLASQGSPEY